MPTRSYYFPKDFLHLEAILQEEPGGFSENEAAPFRARGLPPLRRAGALPLFLGISPKTIYSIRSQPRKHYRSFELRKKDGTPREIDTPRTYLKVIHWWILDNILNHVEIVENVFGFVAGRSAVQNAEFHYGAKHVLNVDIENFFPSITLDQVIKIYKSLGYNSEVSEMLAELCCLDGRLPQGAPTSPALANLVLRRLDQELVEKASLLKIKYSRYADDLTFSSSGPISVDFLGSIREIVEREGFQLKDKKTRFAGQGARLEVTGVVINEKIQPNRVWRKRTRATLHKLSKAPRLTRRNLSFLLGIKGMANQFPDSLQMQRLSDDAEELSASKSKTVIGRGNRPILPNSLTIRQAEVLAALAPRKTNTEIALHLGITEAAVKKRLQGAFKKIGVSNRNLALKWATKNL